MDILWNKHAPARTASFHVSPVLKWTSKGPCQINQSQAHCEDSKQGLQVRVEHSPKFVVVASSLVHANPIIHNECFQFSCREIISQGWHSLLSIITLTSGNECQSIETMALPQVPQHAAGF